MAQLIVTQEYERKLQQERGTPLQAFADPALYNPISLYAYVTLKTGWTHREMATMHYLTFFAYVREFLERDRREQAEQRTPYAPVSYNPQFISNRTVDF